MSGPEKLGDLTSRNRCRIFRRDVRGHRFRKNRVLRALEPPKALTAALTRGAKTAPKSKKASQKKL
jgi:hypothetical protein